MGILAAQCAFLRGAARVVIIDEVPFRLDFATKKVPGIETINFKEKNTIKELRTKFPHGPDVAIEAVGVHYVQVRKQLVCRLQSRIPQQPATLCHRLHVVSILCCGSCQK